MYDIITVGSATVDALVRTEFSETIHDKKNNKFETNIEIYLTLKFYIKFFYHS